jgi:hypothetical protein
MLNVSLAAAAVETVVQVKMVAAAQVVQLMQHPY